MNLSRRAVLIGGVASARAEAPELQIVDTHIHLYDPTRLEGVPWPPKNDTLLYRSHMATDFRHAVAATRVKHAVIIEASPWPSDNDWILARAREDHAFVCVVGNLRAGSRTFAPELDRLRENPLFRGIRIGGQQLARHAVIPDLRRVSEAGLSIDVLTRPGQFEQLVELATKLPDARLIIDHLPFYPSPAKSLEHLQRAPNVWIKVSAVDPQSDRNTSALDELFHLFGPKRLVYGSNWPVSNKLGRYEQQYGILRRYFARKTLADQKAFFFDNARAVYRWPA